MKSRYRSTVTACFVGYIVQAIVNNFVPLLFLTLQAEFDIPLSQITLLVTFNFGVQLVIDLLSVSFVDRIGARTSMLLAHGLAAAGLLLLTVLPGLMPSPFAGILIAVTVYAVGGGLLEVLVSPIVEACPSDSKERAMSMLHSFYCWGHVGVVLVSTLFFFLFGIRHWRVLAALWALLPAINGIAFSRVPLAPLLAEGQKGLKLRDLLHMKLFWLLMLMMLCAGASEQGISQWASAFAEEGLGISKTAGDLAGPMAFAVLMGTARAFYGKYGEGIDLDRFMSASSLLCILAYLGAALLQLPLLNLVCCALCGLSVGIMWPGTFSRASAAIPGGGTALFAMLALSGDIGCAGGPTLVGLVSALAGGDMKRGLLVGVLFPLLLLAGIFILSKSRGRPAV